MRFESTYPSQRSPVLADNMVATSQPLAAQAGLDALARGGNAVDAALAAAITLTVVEPTGNGVGSDAFAIVHDGDGLTGLNASGRSPAAWTPQRFAGYERMPLRGWESVTTPGAVSAWTSLSERFGALPFAALFERAVTYAEGGFAVSPIIAALWAKGARELRDQPGFAEAFLPEGRPPGAGERFRNPALARTLRRIAETRGEAFYRGELAERMEQAARDHGAALRADDLAAHRPQWQDTIAVPYNGIRAHELPPNGQGIAALIALGILERTELREVGPETTAGLHLQIEAMKLGLADAHAHVGEPETMTVTADDLLDPAYLDARAAAIDRRRAGDPGHGQPRPGGTVYLTTADDSGRMVSFIQSNYLGFGSGVVVPETGISLQGRGGGFSLTPGHANQVGPGKRPFHTIIPGFLTAADHRPLAGYGVMGGPMQAQGHVQMVIRLADLAQEPQAACDAPRWQVLGGRSVAVEPAVPESVRAGLAGLGHEITADAQDAAFGFGGAQIIYRLGDGYAAGSDPRKDGQAAGF
ncbi:gamma-glutamyltransferase family protein [Aquisalimonas lutea]|uniref:gamma-glutamyltransferase family protein n=1 Tax=Aquisalimonas lutea TaxID=1327750 RepID=UPI0025B2B1AD|nr:gamma-glutamyltransferase family protein [Aquisalimonas lutea]MDN3516312.1 gamma-glutamyltransferase family protein [Aquisalimonas lutea]